VFAAPWQEGSSCIRGQLLHRYSARSESGKTSRDGRASARFGAIGRGLDQIPVSLQKDEKIFAHTLTNHFGEFRLVLEDTDNVLMIVDVTVDRRLVVPLPS